MFQHAVAIVATMQIAKGGLDADAHWVAANARLERPAPTAVRSDSQLPERRLAITSKMTV